MTLNGSNEFILANLAGGNTTVNVSGGTITTASAVKTFIGNRAPTSLTVSNTGVVTLGVVDINFSAATGTSTVTLGDGTNFTGGSSIVTGGTSGVLAVNSFANSTNNYGTFTFNFDGGTLQAITGAAVTFWSTSATTTATVQDAGGVINNNGASITISQPLIHGGISTTDGGMVFQGSGTTTLSGANAYNGGTIVNAGTLTISGSGTLGATTGTLRVNNPNTGAATAVVLNLNTTAATTTGSLSGTIATASSGTNTATINNSGSSSYLFTVNQTTAGTYAGVIKGAGGFALGSLSTATLALTGANTYTGATTINAGTLRSDTGGIDGSSTTSGIAFGGGTLQANSLVGITTNKPITATSTILLDTTYGPITLGGTIASTTNGLTLSGANTLTLTSASNAYTGPITINGGTLRSDTGGIDGSDTTNGIAFGGGTLQANSLAGINTNKAISASGTILLDTTYGPITLGGGIASTSSGLTLSGANALTLSSVANYYSGATTINSGTLNLTGALPNSSGVSVASGAVLTGSGNDSTTGLISNTVTAAGGSTISLGPTASTALLVNSGITLGSNGSYGTGNYTTLSYTLGASGAVEALNTPAALTLNSGGAWVNITNPAQIGTYTLANYGSLAGSGGFSLSSTTGGVLSQLAGRDTETLIVGLTSLSLTIVGPAIPPVAYWNGGRQHEVDRPFQPDVCELVVRFGRPRRCGEHSRRDD